MKTLPILLLAFFPACIIGAQSSSTAPALEPPSGARAAEDQPNLLTNGNFEAGTDGWELINWGKDGKMSIDTIELHDGKPTLLVENLEPCHTFIRQILKGKPNTRYQISGYIKTKDVEPAEKEQKTGAVLEIGQTGIYTPLIIKTEEWKKVSAEFTTKEDGEIRIGPSLGTDPASVTGIAWFSDLRLIELGDKPKKATIEPALDPRPFVARVADSNEPNLLANGSFEEGTAGWELLNWGKGGKMSIDTIELRDGKPTLLVENLEPCHTFIRQIVKGKPNTHYRISGYIKTKDVEPAEKEQNTGAVLEIGRTGIYTPMMVKTQEWKKVSAEFTTKEDGEIRIGPSLGTDPAFVTGTAWFSGLRLIELDDEPKK